MEQPTHSTHTSMHIYTYTYIHTTHSFVSIFTHTHTFYTQTDESRLALIFTCLACTVTPPPRPQHTRSSPCIPSPVGPGNPLLDTALAAPIFPQSRAPLPYILCSAHIENLRCACTGPRSRAGCPCLPRTATLRRRSRLFAHTWRTRTDP
jgi:hypothetical protein